MNWSRLAVLALVVATAAGAQERPASEAAPCVEPAAWYTVDGARPRRAAALPLIEQVAKQRIVLLGEQHDSFEDHAWQLQTLAALHLLRPDMAIGFESFPRRLQPVLDRWVAGELTAQQFLKEAEWDKVWRFPPALYLPLFEFARLNRIPMIALNVERGLTEAVAARGWDDVPETDKEGLSRPAPASAGYEQSLYEAYLAHDRPHGKSAGEEDPRFRRFVESQLTWDRAMAEALAARARPRADGTAPLVVGILGNGHVRHRYGVPHQLDDLGVQQVAALMPVDAVHDCSELEAGLADAVFVTMRGPAEPPPRPRLGVQLAGNGNDVAITAVTAGSLAEQSGLRAGDRIVSIAGQTVKSSASVVAAVRAQPPGTWLPMTVRRADETLDLVIRFPPDS